MAAYSGVVKMECACVCVSGQEGAGSGGAGAQTLLALSDFIVRSLCFPEDHEGMGMC